MKGRKKLGKYLTIEFSRGERERERESERDHEEMVKPAGLDCVACPIR
jgi:hypothetical protein